jgi:hypothetical protein
MSALAQTLPNRECRGSQRYRPDAPVVRIKRRREEKAGEREMAILTFASKQPDFVVGCSGHFGTAFVFKVERVGPKYLKIESSEAELSEF